MDLLDPNEFYSITETSLIFNITRAAVYVAIRKGSLRAILITGEKKQWMLQGKDIIEYHQTKYSVLRKKIGNELLYDATQDRYNVAGAAKLVGCSTQHIYYLIHTGTLKGKKHGAAWIISGKELLEVFSKKKDSNQIKFA